jgi:hypothetical protein
MVTAMIAEKKINLFAVQEFALPHVGSVMIGQNQPWQHML